MINLLESGFNSLRNNSSSSISISAPRIATSIFVAFFVKRLYKVLYKWGVGLALDRYQSRLIFYSSRKDKELYKNFKSDGEYVNVGAGAFKHPYWTNIDYKGQSKYYQMIQGKEGVDYINLNLCKENVRLPFDNNSVNLIYCSHTLEHLQTEHALYFLREAHRILQPGGAIRLVLPDIKADFEIARIMYIQLGPQGEQIQKLFRKISTHMLSPTTDINIDELIFILIENNFDPDKCYPQFQSICDLRFLEHRPEQHISFWTHDRLNELSKDLGFNIYMPLYRGSTSVLPFKNIDLFDTTESHTSIYGEYLKL
ncbi:MAG: methyltransferase domain-containing protein [Burkholderiaceae bacterium]|nr:methyltransferase domain-containing protein [Burkholderiaceae bacterium]